MNQDLLTAAGNGDEYAFARLIAPYRAELSAHCYRMLGSIHDAEDALQEALLRAWRGVARFQGRSSLRSWLYTIATNACLRAIERRPKRVLPIDYGPAATDPHGPLAGPLVESVWIDPYPSPAARYEQRESVELAFIAALQHLPAQQRAVLILRDVLGFSGAEVAETLETSPDAVYSALQRAHKTVEQRLPERSQQATLRSLGDERMRALVEAYVDAWARHDVEALRALLAEDAVFSMPPWASWWHGRDRIADFARTAEEACRETRMFTAHASGQLAIASYGLDSKTGRYTASAIDVLTLEGSLVKEITAFVTPEIFPAFGLPAEVAP